MSKKSILFIHGAWMTPLCWEKYIAFFQERGYQCLAPSWPYDDRSVDELRASPDPGLSKLGISEIAAHYEKIIRDLPEPPVLVGHSFGGLFVQMLLDRGLGSAGVAINSAPPKGVLAVYWSVIKCLSWILRAPTNQNKVLGIPFKEFKYAFVNDLSFEEQKVVYERYVVPAPGRVFFQAASAPLNDVSRINFLNDNRAPLLLIAGSKDLICPSSQIHDNFRKYKNSSAATEFKEFDGFSHWIIAQKGWEKTALFIDNWICGLKQGPITV